MPKQMVDVAFVRPIFPAFVEWLSKPETLNQFADEGKKTNWNWINEVERQCGLPESVCPEHAAAQRWELSKDDA